MRSGRLDIQSIPVSITPFRLPGRKSGGSMYCLTATRDTLDTIHAFGGRYGNGIFHCILGVKGRAVSHLAQIEQEEVQFLFVLRSKTNSSPDGSALRLPNVVVHFISGCLLSSTRLFEATLLRVSLMAVGQYVCVGRRFGLRGSPRQLEKEEIGGSV
ncbi:hypothetical protein AVEN_176467-1 [Araneus ventricosus]|uniref:Uncharacterized protein n=1 Tax=Araneus ventricosus TaxID=182803 RepID=A0A4Y2JJS9_ARAVE|nr:hypothetical protein AVEN_176467-1 [Araneus ventricosus]